MRPSYRFGRESIENITNLIEADLRRKTDRGHRFSFVSFPKSENSFFAVERGQIFAFIPNLLDSAIGHPYSIYRLRYLQPRSILLCVYDAIAVSENLDLIRSSFSSTFSVNTVISGRISFTWPLKLFFLLHLLSCNIGRHIEIHHISHSRKMALWDTNLRLEKLIAD